MRHLVVRPLAIGVIVAVPVAVFLQVKSGRFDQRQEPRAAIEHDRHVSVHAAGRGAPLMRLRDGHETSVLYRGNPEAIAALENGTARSRSLASADFDRNGTPDVVAGYDDNGSGVITLQRGNPDAFAPSDDSVFRRLQQGYNPAPLLPWADVYRVPVSPDLLVTGNFTGDSSEDVLVAAKGGGLYLLAGDGRGGLGSPQPIALPGAVTALAAGQFRAADAYTDIAVGVSGRDGDALLIFDDAPGGFTKAIVQQPLAEPARAIEFGGLDADPFQDVVVAEGREILVMHGWGRKRHVTAESRVERINLGVPVRGLAVGEFAWDRESYSEIAALSEDGAIRVLQNQKSDTRPFTAAEAARRTRGTLQPLVISRAPDVEAVAGWQRGRTAGWRQVRWLAAGDDEDASFVSARPLLTSSLSYRETHDLIVVGGGRPELEIVHPVGPRDRKPGGPAETADLPSTILDTDSAPVAVLVLPRKLNGVTDVLMLSAAATAPSVFANDGLDITVDMTGDSASASACLDAVANDCSVRGAFIYANQPAHNNTTIHIHAGTYILSINGTTVNGCGNPENGDLSANQSMTVIGDGSASTTIRQTGNGPGSDGDRVMCTTENFAPNLIFDFSGITLTGGRDGTAAGGGSSIGGGGIIGGEKGNVLTLTNVVLANNQVTVLGSANLGGGGIQWTGGSLNITNSTLGGTSLPGAYTDRTSTTTGNLQAGSGGGVTYTPTAPVGVGATGILTVTGSTFTHNTSGGIGGGGADLLTFAFAGSGGTGSGSATISTSTFSGNTAVGSGGGIVVESLSTTVATTSFASNSAVNSGGGIYVGGASLTLNGTSPSITFTSNTALRGSGVATNVGIDQDLAGNRTINPTGGVQLLGTNTNLTGHDIFVAFGGAWTNTAGSSLTIGNLVQDSGGNSCGGCVNLLEAAFKANNSTTTITGDWTINGGTFVGDTGTVNVAGNLSFSQAAGAGAFTAISSTVNFNGSGAQIIANGTSITFNNLTDANVSQPLALNNSIAVNGTLNVNGAAAILSPAATAVISGTGTLTGTGTARASRIAATADFLTQYTITNKTLANLTIDYTGAGPQTVNNAPAYSHLTISGSGTKTLQGNTTISRNLTINPSATFASGNSNFSLGGNWTNSGTFTPGTGTVTFAAASGVQTLTGNTTFFNLTLNNAGATTNFATTATTVGNDLTATAGTMDGGTSTIIFSGVTDNAGAIAGAAAKNFHNLQINSPATISNTAGGNITIENNYTSDGTFSQAAALTTIFDVDNTSDGSHTLAGSGATTFGNVTINNANTVDGGTHSFNVIGAAFTATGTFSSASDTVSFTGSVAQSITGNGTKSFAGLLVNNANGVQLVNGSGVVDASVSQALTLTTDLTVATGAILQQSGSSAGTGDVIGTVRRADLGAAPKVFGNTNNAITVTSGTPPTQMDVNLVKAAPGTFPAGVKVVPRDFTLTPTGGSGISATVKLRYIDPAELAGGISESRLVLWKNIGGTWTPQGGTPDTAANSVSLSGVGSFSEWAIAEASDLTLTKANNVGGSAVTGQAWNWTLTAANAGAPATFLDGQVILSDNLPNANLTYGTPVVQTVSNITGSANISCAIVGSDLTCTANGGSVTFASNVGASNFDVVFSATPQVAGAYQNPRTGGGVAKIDPNSVVVESNESNNTPTPNTVTIGKANTTTAITSDAPDPSVVGQPVTVQWTVSVSAPGAAGAALTGNVTVSDGTNQCVAVVSAGQCNIIFTSAGAKSITATYAGDTNYNGSSSTPATAHQVNKADTTTTITSDLPEPSTPGQSVIVQWTVTVNAPGSGVPTGSVTVTDGVDSCNAPVATAQCGITLTTTGTRTLTATYPGDTNFNTSSDTESHEVCPSTLVTTTADSGAGSLRQIIAGACNGARVTFDAAGVFATPQTITLTSTEIAIGKDVTVDAGSSRITLSGGNARRLFNVNTTRTLALLGLTISGGQSAGSGGAIFNDGKLTIVNSTLTGNTAADGGAIAASATSASVTLVNTTISANTATGNGGGVAVLGGLLTSINSTVTDNRADNDADSNGTGGGIFHSGGTTTLHNTIVAGNLNEDGASDAADDIGGTIDPASSFNLIGTGGAGGLTNGVNNNQVGVANAGLGPLADNGGRTQTHALLAASPAIEAGSNANLPSDVFDVDGDADVAEALPLDQRGTGFPRVADSADAGAVQTVDIGAFEAHPTVEDIADRTTPEDTALPVTFNIGDGTGSLIASVTATSGNTTLIPDVNLVVSGSGSTRTLTITPAPDANTAASGTATITVTVTATNGRTATDTFVVTVIEVNDSPAPAHDTIADVAEDSGVYTIPFTTLLANDANKGALNESGQVLTITAVGSPTGGSVQINGANVEFTPSANAFGPAGFTYTVTDNGSTNGVPDPKTGTATVSFNVTPVNDPPSFTIAADPPAVNMNAGPQLVNGFAASISQGPNETGQTLTFNLTPNGTTGTLSFAGAPAINATTGALSYTAFNGTAGTATFSVTLSDNGSNSPPNSNTSAPQSFTITVNQGPVVLTTAGSLGYTENMAATAIDAGMTVTDADSTNLAGATIAITGGFVSAEDTLAFTNQLGITGSYDGGTGVLTLTGTTTVANYQTALRSVTYQNGSEKPSTAARTVTFTSSDGTTTGSATRGITITSVNDAPVNAVPGPQGTPQNTPLVFSGVSQISVSDADAGTSAIQITLTASHGTLTLSGTSGLSFSFSDGNGTGAGDGTADATMTFRGTLTNVNAALNGMTFTPTAGFGGAASVVMTSHDLGNTGSGGPLTDTDTVNIQVALQVMIKDAKIAEPASGTASMIFTVTLSAPAPAGGVSVDFTTVDLPPALNHAASAQDYTATSGTLSFAAGEQIKTIEVPVLADAAASESNETFLVVLSSPVGLTLGDDTAIGTILNTNQPGAILISELRTSGPAGAGDDFVEVYNNADTPHTVNDGSGIMDAAHGYGLFKMGAGCSAVPVLIGVIPNGTVIPGRGHFLFVGSAYSLANYGGAGAAAGDQALSQDIESDANVGIFSMASALELSTVTRLDGVGFGGNTGGLCELLHEGTTLTPLNGSALQYSYFRDECGKKGNPATLGACPTGGATKDSNVNADDFVFVDTTGTVTPAGQRLGAPGPQNLGSPRLNALMVSSSLDSTKASSVSPNRLRDLTPQLPNALNGTLSMRLRLQNNTGAPVTRLRLRIMDMSALPFTAGIADVRALTSPTITVTGVSDPATCLASTGSAATPCSVTVVGTTLETPPAQTLGGALNTSMSVATITLATPLAPGASVNFQVVLGVQQSGSFKFFFNVEALP